MRASAKALLLLFIFFFKPGMELPYLQIVLMEKMLKMRGGGGKTRRKCPQISNKSPPKLAFFAEHSVYYLLTLIVLLEKEELEQSSMVYLPLWIPPFFFSCCYGQTE